MSLNSPGRNVAGSILLLSATSCGLYVGPNAMVPLSGDKVPVGVTAGYALYPSGSLGVIFDAEGSMAPPEEDGRKTRGWGTGTVGYAYEPVPDEHHLGVEVKAGPAAGVVPDSGGYPFSVGWTYELAFPYRLSPTQRPWQLGNHVALFPLLIPSVQVVQLVPLGAGHDHAVTTTFVFGLAFRMDSWLAVEP